MLEQSFFFWGGGGKGGKDPKQRRRDEITKSERAEILQSQKRRARSAESQS